MMLVGHDTTPSRKFKGLNKIHLGHEFGTLLCELPTHTSRQELVPVCRWLHTANDGKKMTIISIVCPDYATAPDRCTGKIVYTFRGLGSGVGLVAKRALDAHIRLWKFFQAYSLSVKHIIAMADHEATAENCKRMGVDQNEFIARLRVSQYTLTGNAPDRMPLATPFLSELNPSVWNNIATTKKGMQENIEHAKRLIPKGHLTHVIYSRRRFYENWMGKPLNQEKLERIVVAQALEYAAVGVYLQTLYPNGLFLGADAHMMAPFMRLHMGREYPLLYLDTESYH